MNRVRKGWSITYLLVGSFVAVGLALSSGCGDDDDDGMVCGNSKVEGDEQCDDGNTVGGDGCAENCTEEVSVSCVISEGSEAALQWADARISFPLSGTLPYAVGQPRDSAGNGEIPFVIGATELDPIPIVGVGCACVTYEPSDDFGGNAGTGVAGCGVGLDDTDYVVSLDHYTNDVDPECEEGARVEDGFARFPHEGVCNGPAFSTLSGSGPAGSVTGTIQLSISTILSDDGTCSIDESDPNKGEDGEPCTDDDPVQPADDPPFFVRLTTGTATGEVLDANNELGERIGLGEDCGAVPCDVVVTGDELDCGVSWNPISICAGSLAGVFPVLDFPIGGDSVVVLVQRYE